MPTRAFENRIPGEQPWMKAELEGSPNLEAGFENLSVNAHSSRVLPASTYGKFPENNRNGNYTGALLKVSLVADTICVVADVTSGLITGV